jgi:LPXTG-site transpeptidase (sortase) family protein
MPERRGISRIQKARLIMAVRSLEIFRFFQSYGLILLGLLLASYGVANTAFAVGQPVEIATELILQQAAFDQYSKEPASLDRVSPSLSSLDSIPSNMPLSVEAEPEKQNQDVLVRDPGPPQRLKNSFPTLPGPAPAPKPSEVPLRLVIPAIELDAPVVQAETYTVKVQGEQFQQWLAPNYQAVGWHADSAQLGGTGNTVLNGHNNIYGEVFRFLTDLSVGDTILVYGQDTVYQYQITNHMILPEKYQQLDVRMNNAQWILPSQDERLTLITCWPYESNTHRLIIVAKPISQEKLARKLQ